MIKDTLIMAIVTVYVIGQIIIPIEAIQDSSEPIKNGSTIKVERSLNVEEFEYEKIEQPVATEIAVTEEAIIVEEEKVEWKGIIEETIIGDPDHSHRKDGYIDKGIFEYSEMVKLEHVNPDRIHPQISKYEDYILDKINAPEWDALFEEVLEGRSYDKAVFIKDIIIAIMEIESGRSFDDDEKPSSESSGYGWGFFQIEDVSYGDAYTRTSLVDRKNENEIAYEISLNDRLNPEKSIDWFLAHFHNLLWKTNGDYAQAIQGYNYGVFGLQWLIDDYEGSWYKNLDKICTSINKRTNSSKRYHGDSEYLFKVLSYIH